MKPGTRKSALKRREEIAQAVLRIIGERGLPSLTTARIAAEVGVTNGALYRHFASVDDILIETVRYGVEQIETTFPERSLPPLDRLLALANNRVRLFREAPGIAWLLRSEQAYLSLPEEAVRRLRDVAHRSRQFLLSTLREGALDGSVRADIEPELLLVPVLGTIHAVIGARGAQRQPSPDAQPDPVRVLSALARLLEPPPTCPDSASRPANSHEPRTSK